MKRVFPAWNRSVDVVVTAASRDLPTPDDWMLASFTPHQLEESLVHACFAPNAPRSNEVLSILPSEIHAESEYVRNFVPLFKDATVRGERFYLVVLASPITHRPIYGRIQNWGLSLHVFPGINYQPTTFTERLRNSLYRFLSSPEAVVKPPEAPVQGGSSGLPDAVVPIRLFVIKLEDDCCPRPVDNLCNETRRMRACEHPDHQPIQSIPVYLCEFMCILLVRIHVHSTCANSCGGNQTTTTPICFNKSSPTSATSENTVIEHLYSRLPTFRSFSYTASVYLATKKDPDSLQMECIGYQKRVFPNAIPPAFRNAMRF